LVIMMEAGLKVGKVRSEIIGSVVSFRQQKGKGRGSGRLFENSGSEFFRLKPRGSWYFLSTNLTLVSQRLARIRWYLVILLAPLSLTSFNSP